MLTQNVTKFQFQLSRQLFSTQINFGLNKRFVAIQIIRDTQSGL